MSIEAKLSEGALKDDVLMEELRDEGFNLDSIRALYLIPLLDVAWADGEVQKEERDEILQVIARRGIQEGSEAYDLLQKWLTIKPTEEKYLKAKILVEPLFEELKKNRGAQTHWIVEASRKVAQATGHEGEHLNISDDEKRVLLSIAKKLK